MPSWPRNIDRIRFEMIFRAVIVTGAAAAVVVSGVLAAYACLHEEPVYYLSAAISAPPGDERTLAECERLAHAQGMVGTGLDVAAGSLKLFLETTDPDDGRARIDQVGEAIIARLHPAREPGPPRSERREQLAQTVRELDRQLATITSKPAVDSPDRRPRLLARWEAARTERDELSVLQAELNKRLETQPPDQAAVRVEPARLKAAQAADQRLQADLQALGRREAELAETLDAVLQAGDAHFDTLARAAAAGDRRLIRALEAGHGRDVENSLRTIRQSLSRWADASSALARVWRGQRESASTAGGAADPLACQPVLERAARTFIDETTAALLALNAALESIGEGSDEPTKRLVLRNTLARDLREAMDAREAVASAARSLMLTDNLDLAAALQRAAGLRLQADRRRSRIEAALRQELLANLLSQHETDMADARAQRDRLRKRAAQLDQVLTEYAAEAMAMIRQHDAERSQTKTATGVIDGLRAWRADLLAKIAALDQAPAEENASASAPPDVRYLKAGAIRLPVPPGRRMRRALLLGSAPPAACLAVAVAVWALRAWLRSRRTLEAYARELRTASRRTMNR